MNSAPASIPERPASIRTSSRPYLRHLVVRDEPSERSHRHLRILSPEQAKAVGSYYSEPNSASSPAARARRSNRPFVRASGLPDGRHHRAALVGPRAVHDHRGYDYLIGCASISMADGGHGATSSTNSPKPDQIPRLPALPAAAIVPCATTSASPFRR